MILFDLLKRKTPPEPIEVLLGFTEIFCLVAMFLYGVQIGMYCFQFYNLIVGGQ